MNILHINEKISSSLSTKLTYYMLDDYLFLMNTSNIAAGVTRDQLASLYKFISTHEIAIVVMYEATASAVVLDKNHEQHEFDLVTSFNDIMDVISECKGQRVLLSKANWEKNCAAVDNATYKFKLKKIPVLRGVTHKNNSGKLMCEYLNAKDKHSIIEKMDGIIGSIVEIHADRIDAFILWEEDNVFGIKLQNGKFICFNCNEDTYDKFRNSLWPHLKKIVDAEQA